MPKIYGESISLWDNAREELLGRMEALNLPFCVSIETVAPLLRQQTERLRLLRRISAVAVAILTALWVIIYIVVEVRWRNGQMVSSLIYVIEHVVILAVLLSLAAGLVAHARLLTGDAVAGGVRRERFLILQQIIVICVAGIIVVGALVAFGTRWNRGVLYPDWQQPAVVGPVRDSQSHSAQSLDCKAMVIFAVRYGSFARPWKCRPRSMTHTGNWGCCMLEFGAVRLSLISVDMLSPQPPKRNVVVRL